MAPAASHSVMSGRIDISFESVLSIFRMTSSGHGQHQVFPESDIEEADKPRGSGDKDAVRDAENFNRRKYFQDAKRKGWRLIMRNLAFSTKKEDLQVLCSKFGPFTEIVLPPCKDPRYPQSCAGFAFIQFKNREAAKNAIHSLNMSQKVWEEESGVSETAGDEGEEQEESGSDENDRDEKEHDEASTNNGSSRKKGSGHKTRSNQAVEQGRVVFVRNMSYETTDEMLKESLEKFGEIELAIICRYAESGHSKGSGFVYFESRHQADACLDAITTDPGIMIDSRRIYAHRALPRNDAAAIEKENLKRKPKDKRNLHLLRVGVVRPGTVAARGMSEMDAKKRAKLALAAKAKLRNLHMFVSPTRLVLHNLPMSLTDNSLKSLCFLAAGNPDARITECRIWRDREKSNVKGIGRSRGFGFVAFSEHSDALAALRKLNNNPETFSDERRPIVEFSIENLSALRFRESRVTKSKEKLAKGTEEKGMSEKTRREVEETKREMAAGGQKPLPSHVGPKIRHRDLIKKSLPKRGKDQEPGCELDIKEFVTKKYSFKPDLYSKIEVNGELAHPLYKFLKEEQGGTLTNAIKWNFTKFLVDKNGHVVKRYSPQTQPKDMVKDIETVLSGSKL
ncbi:RNA-binding protein 28 [Toxocara canis]|uniref:RNA-binding protein 28 n=1 Tax=Toxocara canis TaxID=6265 RepID=A0A0B2VZF4_TOXCA|nr:RNA-binding protein 28 [Toxocara canis]